VASAGANTVNPSYVDNILNNQKPPSARSSDWFPPSRNAPLSPTIHSFQQWAPDTRALEMPQPDSATITTNADCQSKILSFNCMLRVVGARKGKSTGLGCDVEAHCSLGESEERPHRFWKWVIKGNQLGGSTQHLLWPGWKLNLHWDSRRWNLSRPRTTLRAPTAIPAVTHLPSREANPQCSAKAPRLQQSFFSSELWSHPSFI